MIIWQNKSIFLVNYVFYLEFNSRIIFNEANFWDILLSSSRWENYLQKRTLIKYICSWHDKLIIVLLINQVRPIDMLSDNDGRSISWNVALLSTFINEVINPLFHDQWEDNKNVLHKSPEYWSTSKQQKSTIKQHKTPQSWGKAAQSKARAPQNFSEQ